MGLTTFDLTNAASYNPAFVTAQGGLANAEAALIAGMRTGNTYFNIHTVNFGGGEIRGFLVAPEPSTVSLSIVGLFGMLAGLRIYSRRRGIVKS
jgi:hypothetical protein